MKLSKLIGRVLRPLQRFVMRIIRLLKMIWCDIGMDIKELLFLLLFSIVIYCIVMALILGFSYLIIWIIGKGTIENAYGASIGILAFLYLLYVVIEYVWRKWKESA